MNASWIQTAITSLQKVSEVPVTYLKHHTCTKIMQPHAQVCRSSTSSCWGVGSAGLRKHLNCAPATTHIFSHCCSSTCLWAVTRKCILSKTFLVSWPSKMVAGLLRSSSLKFMSSLMSVCGSAKDLIFPRNKFSRPLATPLSHRFLIFSVITTIFALRCTARNCNRSWRSPTSSSPRNGGICPSWFSTNNGRTKSKKVDSMIHISITYKPKLLTGRLRQPSTLTICDCEVTLLISADVRSLPFQSLSGWWPRPSNRGKKKRQKGQATERVYETHALKS